MTYDEAMLDLSENLTHGKADEALAAISAEVERLRAALRDLCAKLDRQWYESDPDAGESDGVKLGDPHPWTEKARAALAQPAATGERKCPACQHANHDDAPVCADCGCEAL